MFVAVCGTLVLYLHSLLKLNHKRKLCEDGQMSLFRHRQLRRLQTDWTENQTKLTALDRVLAQQTCSLSLKCVFRQEKKMYPLQDPT